jgi:hypothetical protein
VMKTIARMLASMLGSRVGCARRKRDMYEVLGVGLRTGQPAPSKSGGSFWHTSSWPVGVSNHESLCI